mgnify:CR=1 FL=1
MNLEIAHLRNLYFSGALNPVDLVKQHYATSHKEAAPPMPTLFDAEGKQVQRDIHVPKALQDFRTSLTRR